MKVRKVDIPIYFGFLRIVVTKDFDKASAKLKIKTGHDLSLYQAFAYTDKDKNKISVYSVFFHKDVPHAVIAHEVVHLVNSIYINSGITLDPHNDEPQAYLTGWVTDQIYKALKR